MSITGGTQRRTKGSDVPVLLVHGIWDTGAQFGPMCEALTEAGVSRVETIDLRPNNGRAPVSDLARQVSTAANRLLEETRSERIDVVGFSMGALVTRYWIQRL